MKRGILYPAVAFVLAIAVVMLVPKVFEPSLLSYNREGLFVDYKGPEYIGERAYVLLPLLFGQVSVVFFPAIIVGLVAYWVSKTKEKKD